MSRLMERLVIWHVDTSSTALLNAQLDGRICQPGHGPQGADALRDMVRELARARGGLDSVGLVGGLESRGVALVAAYDSGSALARAQALTAHRGRERERGETLALFGFTGELGRLPLVGADCEVCVAEASEEDHIGGDLSRRETAWWGVASRRSRRRQVHGLTRNGSTRRSPPGLADAGVD